MGMPLLFAKTWFQENWVGVLSDVVLWTSMIGGITLVVMWLWTGGLGLEGEGGKVLTFTFQDANEVTPGAPVKMMGVDVGFVQSVAVKPDAVTVTVKTYRNSPAVPAGAKVTILFTGLAGAKSLEITPPWTNGTKAWSDQRNAPYWVEQPIRLKQALDSQNEIAFGLIGFAQSFSDFFGKQKPVEELKYNIFQADTAIGDYVKALQSVAAQMRQEKTALPKDLKALSAGVQNFSQTSGKLTQRLDTDSIQTALGTVVGFSQTQLNPIRQQTYRKWATTHLQNSRQGVATVHHRVQGIQARIQPEQLKQQSQYLETGVRNAHKVVTALPVIVPAPDTLQKTQQSMHALRQQAQKLNQRL